MSRAFSTANVAFDFVFRFVAYSSFAESQSTLIQLVTQQLHHAFLCVQFSSKMEFRLKVLYATKKVLCFEP